MFDELKKYKDKGHFFFNADDRLSEVCNAPNDSSGVYLIYALERGRVTLVYIGISGREDSNGKIKHRKGGLRGRFLTGKQFGDKRQISWPIQMMLEDIDAIDIYWYVTHGARNRDFPRSVERNLLQSYYDIHGQLPRWNKQV